MSMRDPPLLHQAAESGDIALVKQCLRAGADVNTPDPRSRERFARTPLHWACYGGHLEMVRLLLDAGADVQAKESNGTTPLRRVLCPSSKKVDWQRRIQTAELLISAGANVTDGDKRGRHRFTWLPKRTSFPWPGYSWLMVLISMRKQS